MEKMEGTSPDINKLNIDKLKELFPNVVTEGKIDFDALRTCLGDEVDDSKEKYQFTWKGKSKAIKLAQSPSSLTLRPCKEKSKSWDETENFYIEGDNLEVLKQLQKTYYGKIKMIYIDPPYNTGNDFIYKDNFTIAKKTYLEQMNSNLSSNPDSNGKYHTHWLNMIYPRLLLAKNLLKDDGIIFISIDDHEHSNLKKICDEIFGESNFIINFIWEKGKEGGNDSSIMRSHYDNILCYAKNSNSKNIINLDKKDTSRHINELPEENLVANILEEKNKGEYFQLINLSKQKDYTVNIPLVTGEIITWNSYAPQTTIDKWIAEGKIFVGEKKVPYVKSYLKDELQGQKPSNIITSKYGTTKSGSIEIRELFGSRDYFSYPKPSTLLMRLLEIGIKNNEIVLDFFSGSGTMGDAVYKYNKETNSNVKYIMIQLPEIINSDSIAYKNGYKHITDLAEERLKRIINKYDENQGFKVFKLDTSNIITWNNKKMNEYTLFDETSEVFKSDRTKEDVLYEIMIKYGIFDQYVSKKIINNKTMYTVGKNYMLVCLEDEVTNEDIEIISQDIPRCVVFKESGFKNDNDKINAVYNLEKAGVEDVKCI